jgi:hypothetical protein
MIDLQSHMTGVAGSLPEDQKSFVGTPSPGGDLSRLGSGERNSAKPKVAWRPSERARASQRWGEGEINSKLKIQPLKLPSTMPDFLTLFKAVQTCSSLFKTPPGGGVAIGACGGAKIRVYLCPSVVKIELFLSSLQ